MIHDEPEPILSPHQPGDGGILTMPLRDNVPEPPTDDWQLTTCPSVALSAGRQTRPAGSSHWSPTSEPPAQPAR